MSVHFRFTGVPGVCFPAGREKHCGFTLVEMLLVMTIMAIVLAAVGAGLGTVMPSLALTQAGGKMTQLCEAARMRAMAGNVLTAIVVVTGAGTPEDGRAMTLLEYPPGGPWKQIREWEVLPEGITMDLGNAGWDSFAAHAPARFPFADTEGVPAPFKGATLSPETYAARVFLPSGGLLDVDHPAQWQLVEGHVANGKTIYNRHGTGGGPANYYRIHLLSASGRTKIERP